MYIFVNLFICICIHVCILIDVKILQVMASICMSHGAQKNRSCHTYENVMLRTGFRLGARIRKSCCSLSGYVLTCLSYI